MAVSRAQDSRRIVLLRWQGKPPGTPKKFRSRSYDAVIRVYDEASNVIETHEHAGEVQGVVSALAPTVLLDSVSQMPK